MKNPFKFIHLTDPHMIAAPQRLYGLDLHERLGAAVASINRNFADADLCMITGDLAHWGEAAAYGELREILDGLEMPWHVLIGNHDERQTMQAAFPDAAWQEDGFLQYTFETPAGVFIALDTLNDGRNAGLLCEARLRWLRDRLLVTQSQGRDVFLFMHHAPFDIGIHGMNLIGLQNPEDLIAVLQGFKHVRHLFFGHLHRTCHGSWRGITFSTVKATAHQVGLVLDETTPLRCTLENPAYAVVVVGNESVVVHDHSYLEEDTIFDYERGAPTDADGPPEHQKDWD